MMLPLLVFVGVLALVLLPYLFLIARPEEHEQRRLRKRLASSAASRHIRAGLLKESGPLSSVAVLNRMLVYGGRLIAPTQQLIDQSGKRLTVGAYLLACGCAALVPFLLVQTITGSRIAAMVVAACTGWIPYLWLRRSRAKRILKFEELFPEAVDLITRALRAGHTFQAGLSMVADEIPEPVRAEFRLLFDQQNFGMPLPEALRLFAQRVPLLDAKFFATAVLTQRESGGNLAEVLDNLSSVIRERFKVKRQVRVISAHGRITGWVLAGLPPALSLIFLLVSPAHMQTLFEDPLGIRFIIVALALQVIGTLAIRKIVNIEY